MNWNDITYKKFIEISKCSNLLEIMDVLDVDDVFEIQFLNDPIPFVDIKKNYEGNKLKKDFTKLSARDFIKLDSKLKEGNIPECLSIISGIPVDTLLRMSIVDIKALYKWYLKSFILFIRILQTNISDYIVDEKQKEVFDSIITEFEKITIY